jgi:hypothetical protein
MDVDGLSGDFLLCIRLWNPFPDIDELFHDTSII